MLAGRAISMLKPKNKSIEDERRRWGNWRKAKAKKRKRVKKRRKKAEKRKKAKKVRPEEKISLNSFLRLSQHFWTTY